MPTIETHAKINLFLRVLSREESGYHGIETLFCRISLADRLTIEAVGRSDGPAVVLTSEGEDCGPPEANLAARAAQLVLDATGNRTSISIHLEKRIPSKSGLGGGSSDAAAALEATNQLLGNPVPRHELLQLASKLGADVPFFLSGASLALGWDRGDRLFRLSALPSAPGLLLIPPIGVSTAEAYKWVDGARSEAGRRGALALELEGVQSWGSIARMAGNDFESAVFGRLPAIREAFEKLVATQPLLCRMSGSGSALFAIYRSAGDREDAKMRLGKKLGRVMAFETA
ncbi:MAG: 4-(cytidine 5'-diphospho)-2-C-methyl-D-erythritol kinase [Gemmatimonadota bacterium]